MFEYKDESLEYLVDKGHNVARFVSFNPDLGIRYFSVSARQPSVATSGDALSYLLDTVKSVNVRTFKKGKLQGNPFVYGVTELPELKSIVAKFANQGYYTIVSETIGIHDGGVSGVLTPHTVEFAPEDTPRCVEKPGVCSLPIELGRAMLLMVYPGCLLVESCDRLEFSIHPRPQGYYQERVVYWEASKYEETELEPVKPSWGNVFSTFLGDKTFGLLITHLYGFNVPHTKVLHRRIPPFSFGRHEDQTTYKYIRTAPSIQRPGTFSTVKGWTDPFSLLATEDPTGEYIPAVLVQDAIDAEYSGSAITDMCGDLIIEGVRGTGEGFMVGETPLDHLPKRVREKVTAEYKALVEAIKQPVRFEWVYEGVTGTVYIVQLHCGATQSSQNVIYPGSPSRWIKFDSNLDALRDILEYLDPYTGIIIKKDVGVTSHFGDLLRQAKIPSKIEKPR